MIYFTGGVISSGYLFLKGSGNLTYTGAPKIFLKTFDKTYQPSEKQRFWPMTGAGRNVWTCAETAGLSIKNPVHFNAPVLRKRKPILLFGLFGLLLFTLPTRRLSALLLKLPPRFTRLETLATLRPITYKTKALDANSANEPSGSACWHDTGDTRSGLYGIPFLFA